MTRPEPDHDLKFVLEDSAVADDLDWWRAIGTRLKGGGAASRPSAAFQQACKRQRHPTAAKARTDSFRQQIEQRNRQRAPLHDRGGADIVRAIGVLRMT